MASVKVEVIMDMCYGEHLLDIFPDERGSSRIIVAGASGSGKTELVTRIIKKYSCKFYKVLICSSTSHHPIQDIPALRNKVFFSKELIDPEQEIDVLPNNNNNNNNNNKGLLVVYDDNFLRAANDETVANVFIRGRHLRISAILIVQNLFFNAKHMRTVSLNCNYFLLLKQRDLGQIETLGRQLYGREKSKLFLNAYKRAVTTRPYGYLLADLSISTPEELSLRSNIADEGPCEVVYSWQE